MNVIDCKQGSEEWLAARCGMVTASNINCIMSKKENSKTRNDYKNRLADEIITGKYDENRFISDAMLWGIEHEDEAKNAYSLHSGNAVENVGFVIHPFIPKAGASPDGLVGSDGLLEIKCPNTETHLKYIKEGRIPPRYVNQITFQLACTNRDWVDFVSFDPRSPDGEKIFVKRMERDEESICNIEQEVIKFLEEVWLLIGEKQSQN